MKEKGYCFICESEKDYKVFSRLETRMVKGVPVRVSIDYGICPDCGEAMDVRSLDIANEKRVFEAYKKKTGLLTGEEIQQIRKQKGLSAEEFARALGMGAKTITRYENGAIQTKEINLLLKIVSQLSDEEFFAFTKPVSGLVRANYMSDVQFKTWTKPSCVVQQKTFKGQIQLNSISNKQPCFIGGR